MTKKKIRGRPTKKEHEKCQRLDLNFRPKQLEQLESDISVYNLNKSKEKQLTKSGYIRMVMDYFRRNSNNRLIEIKCIRDNICELLDEEAILLSKQKIIKDKIESLAKQKRVLEKMNDSEYQSRLDVRNILDGYSDSFSEDNIDLSATVAAVSENKVISCK